MIEVFQTPIIPSGDKGQGNMWANTRVYVECGCSVYVGVEMRTGHPAVMTLACSTEHWETVTTPFRLHIGDCMEGKPASALVLVAERCLAELYESR